jgi:DNA-binding NtrC family response regulator
MSARRRILVIEDHDDSRELLVALLRHYGFDVIAYDRCAPAQRHIEDCDIDVALLDVRMPDRCGDDFGKDLRARCPETMIVFVTGEALIAPLKSAVTDCYVLRKPIDTAVLLELLECVQPARCGESPSQQATDGPPPGANV